ncbi:MAG TPA: toll/interleukin-1 receptor domain-containing protein [Croceibacterium sp.]
MESTYRAFISYSHRDAPFARWLHARLETYRLPGGITQLSPAGERKGRLGPIFRDREELPAAEDLSAAVRSALAASDVLVVLCSPEARASPWVTREIALFRELGPERPILAAIVRGEPGEAFPEALLGGREPLAADLRKQGDGRRLGFLKIVAGIAGVPLDTLVQRDAQRNLRRVTAVTLGTAALAVVMAVMMVVALQSRNDARQQRAEAEGLINYMLTDLRTQLRVVGRLDVMESVNSRVMKYCDSQSDLARLADEIQLLCARRAHLRGEDDLLAGRRAEALAKFNKAHDITAELLARLPDDPDRMFSHAQSEYWLGYVSYLEGRKRDTLARWRSYLELAQRLVEREPAELRWRRELGFAEGNLCTAELQPPRNTSGAVVHCARSRDIFGNIAQRSPPNIEDWIGFSNRTGWLADALLAASDAPGALGLRMEQQQIATRALALAPGDARAREAKLLALIGLASTALGNGRKTIARSAIQDARQAVDGLRDHDVANADWAAWEKQVARLEAGLGK